jgi:TonB family protein
MSRKRLALNLLACGSAVLLSAAAAVKLFPLQAARAADNGPVQLLKGGDNLLHRAPVEYPKRAIEKGVAGDVLLSLSLDERGQVQDARVVSGPDELRAAALRSVLRWHYSASAAPGTTEVLLQFRLPEKGERVAEEAEHKEQRPQVERVARLVEELEKALEDPAVSGERREKYEHLLRERQEELEQLKHRLHEFEGARFEYAPQRTEAELRTVRAKLAEQHVQERLLEKMARAQAEQQMLEDRARQVEYVKAARESAEQEEHLKRELAEKRKAEDVERLKMELAARQVETKLLEVRESQPDRVTTYTAERGVMTYRWSLPGRLSAIHGARLGPEALQALLPQLGVKVGDTLDAAGFERAKAAVARFDEHIKVELGRAPEDGGLILLLVGPQP